jgi:excisionase family DNA binding protein
MTTDDLQLLTPKDVAALLKVQERTINYLVQNDQLSGRKVAGKWRFTKADVAAYIDRQGQQGGSQS